MNEKKPKPSANDVLGYIINNGSITVKEGIAALGTTETRTRISELKKHGYHFREEWEPHMRDDGTWGRHKRWFLEEAS